MGYEEQSLTMILSLTDEIRATKHKLAVGCGNDIHRIAENARRRQLKSENEKEEQAKKEPGLFPNSPAPFPLLLSSPALCKPRRVRYNLTFFGTDSNDCANREAGSIAMSSYELVLSAASQLLVGDRLRLIEGTSPIDDMASSVPDDQPPPLSDAWLGEVSTLLDFCVAIAPDTA